MAYIRKNWIRPGVPIAKINRKNETAILKKGYVWDLLNGIVLAYPTMNQQTKQRGKK